MGFRFRRSTKIGPFRITASKRGVGISAGAGPFRVSRSATGRVTRTVRVPGTGISYVSSSSSSTRRRPANTGRPTRPATAAAKQPNLQIPDEQWQRLLAPDTTTPALPFQRNYVRAMVSSATGTRPSLLRLTTGQAENVLRAVGADPAPLHTGGRDSEQLNKYGTWAKWALLGALLLIVIASSPGGIVLAAGIAAWVVVARKGRQRRQEWEDRTWGTAQPTPSAGMGGPSS